MLVSQGVRLSLQTRMNHSFLIWSEVNTIAEPELAIHIAKFVEEHRSIVRLLEECFLILYAIERLLEQSSRIVNLGLLLILKFRATQSPKQSITSRILTAHVLDCIPRILIERRHLLLLRLLRLLFFLCFSRTDCQKSRKQECKEQCPPHNLEL